MQIHKPKPYRNKKYTKWVKQQPDIVFGNISESGNCPHHENIGFKNRGVSTKCDDTHCLPVTYEHHVLIHNDGNKSFYELMGIDPHKEMIRLISKWIDKEHNTDPQVLIINLLTDWLKEQE